MTDQKGDPAKRPPECRVEERPSAGCPHLKEVGGGFSGERYRCALCGEQFFLDYEGMK